MFEQILAALREAARAGRIYLTEHARDEMADDGLTFQDVSHCILLGEIVAQQYDARRGENKYVIYGDCLNEGEIAVVIKLTHQRNSA